MPADEKPTAEQHAAQPLLILLIAGVVVPPVLLIVAIFNWGDATAWVFIYGMLIAAALGIVVALATLWNRLTEQRQFPAIVIKLAVWTALSPLWLYLIFAFVLISNAKF
jgi:hypothetical protein